MLRGRTCMPASCIGSDRRSISPRTTPCRGCVRARIPAPISESRAYASGRGRCSSARGSRCRPSISGCAASAIRPRIPGVPCPRRGWAARPSGVLGRGRQPSATPSPGSGPRRVPGCLVGPTRAAFPDGPRRRNREWRASFARRHEPSRPGCGGTSDGRGARNRRDRSPTATGTRSYAAGGGRCFRLTRTRRTGAAVLERRAQGPGLVRWMGAAWRADTRRLRAASSGRASSSRRSRRRPAGAGRIVGCSSPYRGLRSEASGSARAPSRLARTEWNQVAALGTGARRTPTTRGGHAPSRRRRLIDVCPAATRWSGRVTT